MGEKGALLREGRDSVCSVEMQQNPGGWLSLGVAMRRSSITLALV